MIVTFMTETGSTYTLEQDPTGRWYLHADNVPNLHSMRLPDRRWPIDPPAPWPLVIGQPCLILSAHFRDPKDHPDRMPGGGKRTSPVTDIVMWPSVETSP
jgi:hypothetical protein